jgi:hypothetical protein
MNLKRFIRRQALVVWRQAQIGRQDNAGMVMEPDPEAGELAKYRTPGGNSRIITLSKA